MSLDDSDRVETLRHPTEILPSTPRPAGNETGPVIECLAIMPGQVFPASLHLDENDGLPDQIGERGPLPVGCNRAHATDHAATLDFFLPNHLESRCQARLAAP